MLFLKTNLYPDVDESLSIIEVFMKLNLWARQNAKLLEFLQAVI